MVILGVLLLMFLLLLLVSFVSCSGLDCVVVGIIDALVCDDVA